MQTKQVLTAYGVAAIVFLGLDAAWLATMTQRLYKPAIGHLLAPQPDFVAAALFYPLFIAGIVLFAVAPALQAGRVFDALWRGAALGALAYATYDLTNQATLRGWPWSVTAIDIAWGAFVTAAAAAAACAVVLRTGRV